jgi:hypothetical protein
MSESPKNPTLESLCHNPNGELQQIKGNMGMGQWRWRAIMSHRHPEQPLPMTSGPTVPPIHRPRWAANRGLKLKSASGSSSKSWAFGEPEFQRKRVGCAGRAGRRVRDHGGEAEAGGEKRKRKLFFNQMREKMCVFFNMSHMDKVLR